MTIRTQNITYIKGEDFTNKLVEAINKKQQEQFRNKYRKVDALLIDDVQFIAGKNSSQEELFHTFNTLYEEHKQIILTSDRPPKEINTLEERMKTRFEWGLLDGHPAAQIADVEQGVVLRTADRHKPGRNRRHKELSASSVVASFRVTTTL